MYIYQKKSQLWKENRNTSGKKGRKKGQRRREREKEEKNLHSQTNSAAY